MPDHWKGDPLLMLNMGICRRVEDEVENRRELLQSVRQSTLIKSIQSLVKGSTRG